MWLSAGNIHVLSQLILWMLVTLTCVSSPPPSSTMSTLPKRPHSLSLSWLYPQGMEWRSKTVRTWLSPWAVHNVPSCGIMSAFRSNVKHKCLRLFCRSLTCSMSWMSDFRATDHVARRSKVRKWVELSHDRREWAASIRSGTLDKSFWHCNITVAGCL